MCKAKTLKQLLAPIKQKIAQSLLHNLPIGYERLSHVDLWMSAKSPEREDLARLVAALEVMDKELDFYERHHHHLNTTAPNFAREARAEVAKILSGDDGGGDGSWTRS